MEVTEAIKQRRSIRKFKSDNVEKNQIEKILNSGRLAPSAKNRQPWFFVAITNKNKIEDIANIMINNHCGENEKYDKKVLNTTSSVIYSASVIKEAPVLILVYKIDDENWLTGDNLSLGACIENMCLTACQLGLGSLWIRDVVYAENEIMNYVNLKKRGYKLNSALSIGVPNENPKARQRKSLKDVTLWME